MSMYWRLAIGTLHDASVCSSLHFEVSILGDRLADRSPLFVCCYQL